MDFLDNRASISRAMSDVRKFLLYRLKGTPFESIRNFSKFHDTSDLSTGPQIISLLSPMRCSSSSYGCGSFFFKKTNRGWASLPFTETLLNRSILGMNPFPGRTYFRELRISLLLQFSWWPNWLQGKPRIASPLLLYLSMSSFIWRIKRNFQKQMKEKFCNVVNRPLPYITPKCSCKCGKEFLLWLKGDVGVGAFSVQLRGTF